MMNLAIRFIRCKRIPGSLRGFVLSLLLAFYPIAGGASGDITQAWGASAAFTISLASLASSATWVAGQESTAITSGTALDYLIGGTVMVGTTPTASTQIQIWVYAAVNDTPTYPDAIDGTDSAETMTTVAIRNASLVLAAVMDVDATTSDRAYWFAPFSLRRLFGGVIPKHWGLWVTHNTGVALNATAGNHVIKYTPVYENVAA